MPVIILHRYRFTREGRQVKIPSSDWSFTDEKKINVELWLVNQKKGEMNINDVVETDRNSSVRNSRVGRGLKNKMCVKVRKESNPVILQSLMVGDTLTLLSEISFERKIELW